MTATNPIPTQPETLLPCPFCGSPTPQMRDQKDGIWIDCYRKGCSVEVLADCETAEEAIKCWNRRAAVAGPRGDMPTHPFGPCGYQYCDWPDGELRCNEPRYVTDTISPPTFTVLRHQIQALSDGYSTYSGKKSAVQDVLNVVDSIAVTSSPTPAETGKVRSNHFSDTAIDKGFPDHISKDGAAYYNDGTVLRSAAPAERTRVEGEQRLLTPEELADIERFQQQRRKSPVAEDAWLYVAEIDRLLTHIRLDREQLENEIFQDATDPNFAAAPADNDAESLELLRTAAVLCISGDGQPRVSLLFKELKDAQAVHEWLVRIVHGKSTTTKGDR